ncbi:MAG: DNA polymerase III subunit alpha [Chloroflexi bacterium]|nr:DNA polymerase III subunit alpha [Chloroflexota bacterium]
MAAAASEFVHLHVHSEYSMLDGLSRIPNLIAEAKRHGMPAIALTDHGTLYGAIEFYQEARQQGVKPIIGVEAYVAPRRLTDKETADRSAAHLVLLAKDDTGYRNLLALATRAHLDGFYYRPRIDHELLAEHRQGLVALSACGSGEIPWALRHENPTRARQTAELYRELFGPEDFYLEVQDHGIDFQTAVNRGIRELAGELDLQIVCTNDSHYTRRDDCDAQDLLLCIQTNALVDDPKRLRVYTGEHYLKSPSEMHQLLGSEVPEALRNTLAVAEKCNAELTFGRLDFPRLPFVPDGEQPIDFLTRMCWESLPRRYDQVTTEIEERLRYELDVVRTTGFAAYILFVWDFVDYARRRGILCGPRGSAAGSIILYCLGITTIDPIAHGLTFERFLNPERIQMPDIDMDFADSRRDEVIDYVAERYGRDHVAQIVTFGRLLARAAIRDVGRALGYPLTEVDRVAKLVPSLPVGMTIDRALAASSELKQLYDDEEHVRRLIASARQVEGVARHASTHAAGIVVSGEPLVQHVPLQRGARGENVIMTQFEMHALETIGLLKMDFLGLTNLTLLENVLTLIEETRGIRLDIQRLPLDDAKTFEMLSNGDSTGVFQLEGAGMRRTLREFRPTSVHHLAAIVALYRPGPMAHIPTYVAAKDGRRPIGYLHPRLEPILKDTYGIIVYQDQVLQIVQAIAGYSLGQADILRRAMGKKIKEEMRRERDNFLKGAKRNGVEASVAAKIWEYIEPFAGYAFNRAHAYCYAYIAYQTGYLKCNYPVEYMAAMLTTQSDDAEKVAAAAGECRRLGITILPPDVNRSRVGFSVEALRPHPGNPAAAALPGLSQGERRLDPPLPVGEGGGEGGTPHGVRFGLGAVKNVGDGAARHIVAARETDGAYRSLDELCERVDLRTANRRVLEALTKAGALDAFGQRERVLAALERAMAAGQQAQRAAGVGQQSLFSADTGLAEASPLPEAPSESDRQRLAWEKEALGFFLSSHPYQAAARALSPRVTATTSQITDELKGERVTIAGAIMNVRKVVTKRQESMAVVQMEDLHGAIEAVVFPRTYATDPDLWREDSIVIVNGRIDVRRVETQGDDEVRGVPEIIVDSAEMWTPPPDGERPEEVVHLDEPAPYVNGTADATHEVAQPAEPFELKDPRAVTIVFRETGDRPTDRRRLEHLHATLVRCPGRDRYAIWFEGGTRSAKLVGDELQIHFSEQLERELEAILGGGSVQVEEI